MPAEDIEDRRRRGLPDYEKPPLGQPPSWLQDQERKDDPISAEMRKAADLDPGPAAGNLDVRTVTVTDSHPTMQLRFVKRTSYVEVEAGGSPLGRAVSRMILQQCWLVITSNAQNLPIRRDFEWLDVPVEDENLDIG
jgi:hypothetical protein